MPATRDPRPLTGEPLALDLLNTRWMSEGTLQDLLADVDGLAVWLDSTGLSGGYVPDSRTLRHLQQAREALRTAVDGSLEKGRPWSTPCWSTGGSGSRSPLKGPSSDPS